MINLLALKYIKPNPTNIFGDVFKFYSNLGFMLDKKNQLLFNTNIEDLKIKTLNFSEEKWNEWDWRQKNLDTTKETRTIPFIWHKSREWNLSLPIELEIYNHDNDIWPLIKSQIVKLEEIFNGVCVRCILARLNPNCEIPAHRDFNDSLIFSHRTHIPVKTNQKVLFVVGNQKMEMKEGNCYEIKNQDNHFVKNNSIEHRIHLIIDIMPQSILKFTTIAKN